MKLIAPIATAAVSLAVAACGAQSPGDAGSPARDAENPPAITESSPNSTSTPDTSRYSY